MLHDQIKEIAHKAKDASQYLAKLESDKKEETLVAMADVLSREKDRLFKANEKDLKAAGEMGLSGAMIDRLTLSQKVIDEMAAGLREVASLKDPVGEVTKMWKRPNGLLVGKMRIPLGVIGIIYESRPNVTADSAGLCIKSGNAVILRGGSEAFYSNLAISELLQEVLEEKRIPKEAISILPVTDRKAIEEMLKFEEYIDVIIPRGGEELIRFVVSHSRIPVIKHYKGVCHIFVDAAADWDKVKRICLNAKIQRPGVCNAVETLLCHEKIASAFLPKIGKELEEEGVRIKGCSRTRKWIPQAEEATEEDWSTEYLDLILSVKVVDGLDEAIEHIRKYGSSHTEAIITEDYWNGQRFLREVDSSVVLINASTRFSDGYQLGLGAEIGISTTKLHSFGPMGVEDLTTTKFIIYGNGQIRG